MTKAKFHPRLFLNFIKRRSPPKSFAGNIQAEKAELLSLIGILDRNYTGTDPEQWMAIVEQQLIEHGKTFAWPTGAEVKAAAMAASESLRASHPNPVTPVQFVPDGLAISVKRIKAGEPVEQSIISGRKGQEMIEAGLITQADIDKYRKPENA